MSNNILFSLPSPISLSCRNFSKHTNGARAFMLWLSWPILSILKKISLIQDFNWKIVIANLWKPIILGKIREIYIKLHITLGKICSSSLMIKNNLPKISSMFRLFKLTDLDNRKKNSMVSVFGIFPMKNRIIVLPLLKICHVIPRVRLL